MGWNMIIVTCTHSILQPIPGCSSNTNNNDYNNENNNSKSNNNNVSEKNYSRKLWYKYRMYLLRTILTN